MSVPRIVVHLEHVRSFAEPQDVPLRPLTLLVGENSSGKSTFLAVAGIVLDPAFSLAHPGFNNPPFNLGTFETIATFKGGKYGRDESFTIGFSASGARPSRDLVMKVTYGRGHGGPALVQFEGKSPFGEIRLRQNGERLEGEVVPTGQAKGRGQNVTFPIRDETAAARWAMDKLTLDTLAGFLMAAVAGSGEAFNREQFQQLLTLGNTFESPFGSIAPLAPIRTQPRRTYDDLTEDYSPEGEHVPRMLARLLAEAPTEAGQRLQDSLKRFGEASGLFRDIGVKRLGKGPDDPFQVQVNVGGPRVNLVDVGYGVSQALPLIVESATRKHPSLLLVQQPEVHLHPRAQAALGSFFAELAAMEQHTILVETHSDFLVDRVRLEVARGTLKPEQVQILFFDRLRLDTSIHPISIDEAGNVVDAPDHYREFFMEEQIRILTREGA